VLKGDVKMKKRCVKKNFFALDNVEKVSGAGL
jgi:hypothetical protein